MQNERGIDAGYPLFLFSDWNGFRHSMDLGMFTE